MKEERFYKNKNALEDYFIDNDLIMSFKALRVAEKIHVGKRKNGNPEFGHQIGLVSYLVQTILPRLEYPDETIAALFLHDAVEDYPDLISFESIEADFGKVVVDMVSVVSKVAGFKKTPREYDLYYDGIKASDLGIFVKGIDRINNFQTMVGVFTMKRQYEYIEETEKYILPILKHQRKRHPSQKESCLAISHTLERQIYFIREILKRDEELLLMKARLS